MGELKAPDKPFDVSKRAVWEAYEKVRANKGAPGVDKVSLAEFEKDLKNNLYKIWNRMSSGTYFPPPVRAVEIPKPHGGGTRMLMRLRLGPPRWWSRGEGRCGGRGPPRRCAPWAPVVTDQLDVGQAHAGTCGHDRQTAATRCADVRSPR